MIYPVLGFHKSGTSMLAQTLHKSGIPMSENNASLDNKYEDRTAKAITKDVLGINPAWTNHSLMLPTPINPDHHLPAAKSYITDRNKAADWGFKFPSVLLCWSSLWRPALESIAPTQIRPIGIFRSPFWTWFHYHTKQHAPSEKIFSAWTYYNELLLTAHFDEGVPLLQYADFFYAGPRQFLHHYTGTEIVDCFTPTQHSIPSGTVDEYRQVVPDRAEELYCELIEQKEEP